MVAYRLLSSHRRSNAARIVSQSERVARIVTIRRIFGQNQSCLVGNTITIHAQPSHLPSSLPYCTWQRVCPLFLGNSQKLHNSPRKQRCFVTFLGNPEEFPLWVCKPGQPSFLKIDGMSFSWVHIVLRGIRQKTASKYLYIYISAELLRIGKSRVGKMHLSQLTFRMQGEVRLQVHTSVDVSTTSGDRKII